MAAGTGLVVGAAAGILFAAVTSIGDAGLGLVLGAALGLLVGSARAAVLRRRHAGSAQETP